jgi:hypothetical protein
MTNKDMVFNRDAFADERVARDFAPLSNAGVFLDLHKGANLGFIADAASVQVDELSELHVLSELHIRRDTRIVVGRMIRVRAHDTFSFSITVFWPELPIHRRAGPRVRPCNRPKEL